MHVEGVPPTTGHDAVLAFWDLTYGYGKDMSLQKLKTILAEVWTSWRFYSMNDMWWRSWEQFYSNWNSHVGNECCVGVCWHKWKLELATNFSFRTFFIYLPYKEYATKNLNWTCTVCTNKPKPLWVEESCLKSSIKELLDLNQFKDLWCKYWKICI
jgi:hypothetical protein